MAARSEFISMTWYPNDKTHWPWGANLNTVWVEQALHKKTVQACLQYCVKIHHFRIQDQEMTNIDAKLLYSKYSPYVRGISRWLLKISTMSNYLTILCLMKSLDQNIYVAAYVWFITLITQCLGLWFRSFFWKLLWIIIHHRIWCHIWKCRGVYRLDAPKPMSGISYMWHFIDRHDRTSSQSMANELSMHAYVAGININWFGGSRPLHPFQTM